MHWFSFVDLCGNRSSPLTFGFLACQIHLKFKISCIRLDKQFVTRFQVEESYTREALEAEEREKDLRMKLARAEEQLLSSSHSMLDRE